MCSVPQIKAFSLLTSSWSAAEESRGKLDSVVEEYKGKRTEEPVNLAEDLNSGGRFLRSRLLGENHRGGVQIFSKHVNCKCLSKCKIKSIRLTWLCARGVLHLLSVCLCPVSPQLARHLLSLL